MGKKSLRIQTENEALSRKGFTLLQKTFNIETDVSNSRIDCFRKGNLYCISIIDRVLVKEILDSAKLEFSGSERRNATCIQFYCISEGLLQRAFVRGAFLSAGSISDPQKGYHFEIVCPSREISGQLQEIIHSFHIDAKIVLRKKSYVLYVKEGAQIVDMLAIMEANVALMDLENIRILKEMRNSVNRKVNCETANINKTVNAAVKQIEDIRLLEEKVGLESLNEGLEEIARLRLQYPEATLKELGLMLNPQVGKSGVNHRLRKLSLLADDLRGKQGGVIMIKKPITIHLSTGLEARPVAQLVQVASQFNSEIYVEVGKKKVNAKSIMGMMTLGLDAGEEITLSANGEDEEAAMSSIEQYLSNQ